MCTSDPPYRYCTSIMVEKLSSSQSPAISLSLLHQRSSYRYQSSYYSSDLPIAIMPAIFLSLLFQRSSHRYIKLNIIYVFVAVLIQRSHRGAHCCAARLNPLYGVLIVMGGREGRTRTAICIPCLSAMPIRKGMLVSVMEEGECVVVDIGWSQRSASQALDNISSARESY